MAAINVIFGFYVCVCVLFSIGPLKFAFLLPKISPVWMLYSSASSVLSANV